jgi:hypothetical protein
MPSKLKINKYDYKYYYTDLATLLITQGVALHNCKTDQEVLDSNNKCIKLAEQFIKQVSPPPVNETGGHSGLS